MGPKTAIPPLAAARMQGWAIVLSAYDYQIEYRSSAKHSNCDALSRLPHEDSNIGSESEIYTLSAIDRDFPITATDIGKATLQDPVLSKVLDWVMLGWPEAGTEDLKPYHTRRNELSCEQNCPSLGLQGGHSPSIQRKDVKGVALGAPRRLCNEGNSAHLHLVAQNGRGD